MRLSALVHVAILFLSTSAMARYLTYCGTPHHADRRDNGGIFDARASSAFSIMDLERPWPYDENNLVTITYCFEDEDARDNLGQYVEIGAELWYESLGDGGPAAKQHIVTTATGTRMGHKDVSLERPRLSLARCVSQFRNLLSRV